MFSARPDPCTAMAPARSRILAQIVLGVNALCFVPMAAAQEQPPPEAPSRAVDYNVRIDAPRQLRELLENNLDLMRWRGNPRLDLLAADGAAQKTCPPGRRREALVALIVTKR